MSSVSLQRLNIVQPLNFRLAIYTQWGMIGGLAIIYVFLPESPWWLMQKGKEDKARKSLGRLKGSVEGYDVEVDLAVMRNTIDEQRARAHQQGAMPLKMLFMGLNGKRLLIALWPKLCQQFVGLSVFNNYATYFCESPASCMAPLTKPVQVAGNRDPFLFVPFLRHSVARKTANALAFPLFFPAVSSYPW
jgi:SP family general alpha glucoside:H+ symporter-like MFS transporter